MGIKDDFFEDLSVTYDSWLESSVRALTDDAADLKWVDNSVAFEGVRKAFAGRVSVADVKQVLSDILRGQISSILTIIDGGTKLAEAEKIDLVDSNRQVISSDLHSEFISYLLETDRMQ